MQTPMGRRLLVWGAVFVAVVLLALLLQGTIQDICIVPAIQLLWMAGLMLRSIPQWVYWSLLVAGGVLVALISLGRYVGLSLRRAAKEERAAAPGPIEKLAGHIHNTKRGIYFKWLIAHRLGELEQAVVLHRGGGTNGARKLMPPQVQAYLEAGMDRPPLDRGRWGFRRRRTPTPLGLDPSQVVEYLASEMETEV